MQRGYKKKLDRGESSLGMTVTRAARLEALGLAWVLSRKQYHGPRRQANTAIPRAEKKAAEVGSQSG